MGPADQRTAAAHLDAALLHLRTADVLVRQLDAREVLSDERRQDLATAADEVSQLTDRIAVTLTGDRLEHHLAVLLGLPAREDSGS